MVWWKCSNSNVVIQTDFFPFTISNDLTFNCISHGVFSDGAVTLFNENNDSTIGGKRKIKEEDDDEEQKEVKSEKKKKKIKQEKEEDSDEMETGMLS